EFGREQGLLSQRFRQLPPLSRRQALHLDGDVIGLGSRALHFRRDDTLVDVDGKDLSAPGVGAAAAQAGADVETFQHLKPALGPPTLAELAALGLGLDAALRLTWPGAGKPKSVIARRPHRITS